MNTKTTAKALLLTGLLSSPFSHADLTIYGNARPFPQLIVEYRQANNKESAVMSFKKVSSNGDWASMQIKNGTCTIEKSGTLPYLFFPYQQEDCTPAGLKRIARLEALQKIMSITLNTAHVTRHDKYPHYDIQRQSIPEIPDYQTISMKKTAKNGDYAQITWENNQCHFFKSPSLNHEFFPYSPKDCSADGMRRIDIQELIIHKFIAASS